MGLSALRKCQEHVYVKLLVLGGVLFISYLKGILLLSVRALWKSLVIVSRVNESLVLPCSAACTRSNLQRA
jgi:hypothetical protein